VFPRPNGQPKPQGHLVVGASGGCRNEFGLVEHPLVAVAVRIGTGASASEEGFPLELDAWSSGRAMLLMGDTQRKHPSTARQERSVGCQQRAARMDEIVLRHDDREGCLAPPIRIGANN